MRKTLEDRYADLDMRRVIEHPRDELENEYAQAEDVRAAKAIWDRFGTNENHRRRVLTLLAREALNDTPSRNEVAEGLLNE